VDESSTKITITPPEASDHDLGKYIIKKMDDSNHTVTLKPNGTEKIDGEVEVVIRFQYSYVDIVSNNDEWIIVGGRNVKLEEKLSSIETLLEDFLERNAKQLLISQTVSSHIKENSTHETDDDEIEEEIREMLTEVDDKCPGKCLSLMKTVKKYQQRTCGVRLTIVAPLMCWVENIKT